MIPTNRAATRQVETSRADIVTQPRRVRIRWTDTLTHAAAIVRSYKTPVTLRQLFYRLVADQTLPNTQSYYKTLSARTAEARRAGTFPELADRKRAIEQELSFSDGRQALLSVVSWFKLDRTIGQEYNVLLGVEKAGLLTQLQSWFYPRGLPITALGGYMGQTRVNEIKRSIRDDGRPAVLLYAGDFDASGIDIERDFVKRVGLFDRVHRVALDLDQIDAYGLPENPSKEDDPRLPEFVERFGRDIQVEVDALPPNVLRQLYEDALKPYWDTSAFDAVMADEADQRDRLTEFADGWAA